MKLSKFEAYKVFYCFLDKIWKENKSFYSRELPILLSSMQLLNDGVSADPALLLNDWDALVASETLTIKESYEVAITFLKTDLYFNDETKVLLDEMELMETKWMLWRKCIRFLEL